MKSRLKFQEKPCFDGQHLVTPLTLEDGSVLQPVISCPAQFPLELFGIALMTLINHPEYNSSLILRTEILSDESIMHDSLECSQFLPSIRGFTATRNIRRRLLPRRPGRDGTLNQDCTLYLSHDATAHHPAILVLTPCLAEGEALPYYHPAVAHLAFRYVATSSHWKPEAHLIVEIAPLKDVQIDLSSRLYRTCLALLETLDRYGWGAANNYQKRVHHDILVPRNDYQDLYILLKERHKSLVDNWHESTDPLKHVFEDIGIATFLMLLWKDTYKNSSNLESTDETTYLRSSEVRPWDDWPRPLGGFVDVGCGNGVLTHILLSEGYIGEGFDLRARTSWSHYPAETQRHLHVQPFTPFEAHPLLQPSCFLIGNHADELTPWIPVVSTLLPASGYLSIPCCPWDFDVRYERGGTGAFRVPQYEPNSAEHDAFVAKLGLGAEGQAATSYSKHRIWLAYLSRACGWKVECEMLRIPSTRNWAIVGREMLEQETGREVAQNIISAVQERGIFVARTPEGKTRVQIP